MPDTISYVDTTWRTGNVITEASMKNINDALVATTQELNNAIQGQVTQNREHDTLSRRIDGMVKYFFDPDNINQDELQYTRFYATGNQDREEAQNPIIVPTLDEYLTFTENFKRNFVEPYSKDKAYVAKQYIEYNANIYKVVAPITAKTSAADDAAAWDTITSLDPSPIKQINILQELGSLINVYNNQNEITDEQNKIWIQNGGEETEIPTYQQFSNLKSAVNVMMNDIPTIELSFTSGTILVNGNPGGVKSSLYRIRSTSKNPDLPKVEQGDYYFISGEYEAVIAIYNDTTLTNSNFINFVTTNGTGAIKIPDIYIGKYAAICLKKVGHEDDDISNDIPNLGNYVKYYRPSLMIKNLNIPNIDNTLTNTGDAADAKTVGDEFEHVNDEFEHIHESIINLNNTFSAFDSANQITVQWSRGSLNGETGQASTVVQARRCRSAAIMLDRQTVVTDMQSQFVVFFYNGGTSQANYLGKTDWLTSCNVKDAALSNQDTVTADRFRLMGAMIDNETNIGDGSSDDVTRCTDHIFVMNKYMTNDDVDTKVNAASETMEKRDLSILPVLGFRDFQWNIGYSITDGGTITHNSNSQYFALSEKIPVRKYQHIINATGDTGSDGKTTAMHVCTYNGETFGSRTQITSGQIYTVPDNVTDIRFLYGYPSSVTNRPVMSWQLMEQYFKVRMLTDAAQVGMWNDGTKPVYVAFGASTTKGAVHSQDGISYSQNNWPDYLGRIFGLETYNLGVGSTGFMERGDRYLNNNVQNPNYGMATYYPNICDSILQNDALLQKAGLITIMFGYGNDNWVGPIGNIKRFQIGNYNDYYPYDKAARIGYDPVENPDQKRENVTHYDTADGLSEMVMDGATLMGCLNWCIEWISTKYPYAQLFIIFGSPSANDGREITKAANSETPTQGVAPYKLTFASDPYQSAEDHAGKEYGVYLINEQLKLLVPALNIPVINTFYGGNAFNWYSTYAKDPADNTKYALFSTKGTAWNSHPNDAGYLYFARFIAGRIASMFRH